MGSRQAPRKDQVPLILSDIGILEPVAPALKQRMAGVVATPPAILTNPNA